MSYHWRTGWTYYYEMEDVCFVPGEKYIFTNWYTYEPALAPTELDGDVYFAVEDLKKLFAPDMTVTVLGDGTARFVTKITREEGKHEVDSGADVFQYVVEPKTYDTTVSLREIDGFPCAPVFKLLVEGYGFTLSSKKSHEGKRVYNISLFGHADVDFEEDASMEGRKSKMADNVINGKCMGDLNRTFWFAEGNKLMPYMLFVPSTYDGTKAMPLVTVLHGGAPEPNMPSCAVRAHGQFQMLAEDLGWFVLFPVCYARNGTYGCPIPPNRGAGVDMNCPENPGHYPPEVMERVRLSERCLEQTLEDVFAHYKIDKDHLYLTGNSMGGGGTYYFTAAHPGMFRAIAPTGAFINADLYQDEGLGDTPVYCVGGMEDRHGYEYIRYDALKLIEKGHNVTLRTVGGGLHGDSWVTVLPEIFDFFKKNF